MGRMAGLCGSPCPCLCLRGSRWACLYALCALHAAWLPTTSTSSCGIEGALCPLPICTLCSACCLDAPNQLPVPVVLKALCVYLQVDVYPCGIKQQPGRRVEEPVSFIQAASMPSHVQFPHRLSMHLRLRQEAQQLIPSYRMRLGRFLICPAARSRFELEDHPVGSGGCTPVCRPTAPQAVQPGIFL